MRKVAVLVVLAMAVPVLADMEVNSVFKVLGGPPGQRDTAIVYDNTVNGTGYAYGGPALGTPFGDELTLVYDNLPGGYDPNDAPMLSDLTISAGTFQAVGLQYCDIDVSIFNYNPDTGGFDLAGSFSEAGVQFPGYPYAGYFYAVTFSGLDPLGIVLTDDILVTISYSNANAGVTNIGQLIYDPPVVGYSGNYFYQAGNWYWFGGSPVANFYYQVGAIPEPGSLVPLALGALTLVRRR